MPTCRALKSAPRAAAVGLFALGLSGLGLEPARAADMTVRQLTERLYHSDAANPLDLSGLNLAGST